MFNKQKPNPIKSGIIAGILQVIYITLLISLGTCVTNAFRGRFIDNQTLGPILFLTVFVFSAAISALIVLGYPAYLLVMEKKVKEAIQTTAITLITLLILGIVIFGLLVV